MDNNIITGIGILLMNIIFFYWGIEVGCIIERKQQGVIKDTEIYYE